MDYNQMAREIAKRLHDIIGGEWRPWVYTDGRITRICANLETMSVFKHPERDEYYCYLNDQEFPGSEPSYFVTGRYFDTPEEAVRDKLFYVYQLNRTIDALLKGNADRLRNVYGDNREFYALTTKEGYPILRVSVFDVNKELFFNDKLIYDYIVFWWKRYYETGSDPMNFCAWFNKKNEGILKILSFYEREVWPSNNSVSPEIRKEAEETYKEALKESGNMVVIDELLPTVFVSHADGQEWFFQESEATQILNDVPDNVGAQEWIFFRSTSW